MTTAKGYLLLEWCIAFRDAIFLTKQQRKDFFSIRQNAYSVLRDGATFCKQSSVLVGFDNKRPLSFEVPLDLIKENETTQHTSSNLEIKVSNFKNLNLLFKP